MERVNNSSKQTKKQLDSFEIHFCVFREFFITFNSIHSIILDFRVCLIQFECKGNLSETLTHLRKMVSIAVEKHQPRIIALPECFYIPYETTPSVILNAAESIPNGETCKTLSELAKKYSVYIVGGSIVERDSANLLYNTSTVWSPNGELIARHRKVRNIVVVV